MDTDATAYIAMHSYRHYRRKTLRMKTECFIDPKRNGIVAVLITNLVFKKSKIF